MEVSRGSPWLSGWVGVARRDPLPNEDVQNVYKLWRQRASTDFNVLTRYRQDLEIGRLLFDLVMKRERLKNKELEISSVLFEKELLQLEIEEKNEREEEKEKKEKQSKKREIIEKVKQNKMEEEEAEEEEDLEEEEIIVVKKRGRGRPPKVTVKVKKVKAKNKKVIDNNNNSVSKKNPGDKKRKGSSEEEEQERHKRHKQQGKKVKPKRTKNPIHRYGEREEQTGRPKKRRKITRKRRR